VKLQDATSTKIKNTIQAKPPTELQDKKKKLSSGNEQNPTESNPQEIYQERDDEESKVKLIGAKRQPNSDTNPSPKKKKPKRKPRTNWY
jgi:hypothetical protein